MRVAALVFLGYGLVLVLGVVWPYLPLGRVAPDVVALCAVYLGLTARHRLAPSMLGAVIIGYLADLLIGSPRGLMALTAGVVCLVGHLVHQRLIVRGWLAMIIISAFSGLLSGVVVLGLRAYVGESSGFGSELLALLGSALLTGGCGPVVFRLCRNIDARFARTQRERDAALEGLIP
jgi:rod shape-determining protein MreD